MTAKKTVATKTTRKKPVVIKPVHTHEEKLTVILNARVDVWIQVPDGDYDTLPTNRIMAVDDFVKNNITCDIESNDNDFAVVGDVDIVDFIIDAHEIILPQHMDATAGDITIAGSGESLKEMVESLREVYDASGTDMPKHLHDIVFSLESQMGIV
jgi:hypothetical protein